jgi:phosphoadenosine phosphosulfate reductase
MDLFIEMSRSLSLSTAEQPSATLDLAEANRLLEGMTAQERITWAVNRFGQHAVLLSSMQKTSSVLMYLFHQMGIDNEILFVDTGFHFHETLAVRDAFLRRYRLNIVTLYPKNTPDRQEQLYGVKLHLFRDGQPQCCEMRKEHPFVDRMKAQGHRVVMNGLRRSEGGNRGNIPYLGVDPRFAGYKLNPILDWSDDEVERFLSENDVLVHPLHAQSYPSIGCACCTTPVAPGEDARAGRWRHLNVDGEGPKYCGINFSDGSGI